MTARPYGPYQKRMFRRLRQLGVLDQVGLADELATGLLAASTARWT